MKKVYCESTVEKCLQAANRELSIPIQELQYKILEEKKSLFKKKAIIEVEVSDENIDDGECESFDANGEEEKAPQFNEKDGTIEIIDGNLIIKDPEEEGKPATILIGNDIKVIIDGNEVKGKKEIFKENKIEISFDESTASRSLNITISEDYMEA